MEASELIATLQDLIDANGDLEVIDSDGYPIEEISLNQLYPDQTDFVIYSEGDEH